MSDTKKPTQPKPAHHWCHTCNKAVDELHGHSSAEIKPAGEVIDQMNTFNEFNGKTYTVTPETWRHVNNRLKEYDAVVKAKQENDERFQLEIGQLKAECELLREKYDGLLLVKENASLKDEIAALRDALRASNQSMYAQAKISLADTIRDARLKGEKNETK